MSEQHAPTPHPLPPDVPSMGSVRRRHRIGKPKVADFTLGLAFVAERIERNGFRTYLECILIDAYADELLAGWDSYGICVFARVRAVNERKHLGLVGHIVKVAVGRSEGHWFWHDVRATPLRREDIAWITP